MYNYKYKEEKQTGDNYRREYLDSIDGVIGRLEKAADIKRKEFYGSMDRDALREELKKMFGWPLTEYKKETPDAEVKLIDSQDGRNMYRVQLDLPIGVKMYGIYFEHSDEGKLPVVVAQHGAEGTPESCSGLFADGTYNYNDMTMRIFERGVNVFAPQLLLWSKENYSVDYDRQLVDARLKRVGSSITAVEVYGIMKCIDWLQTLDSVDEDRVGMIGLSYGSFFTINTTAVDTRIKAALGCSQFSNRFENTVFSDWTWENGGFKFLDAEIASLIYPRYLCLEMGDNDEIFRKEGTQAEFERLRNLIGDPSWGDFLIFEGSHEFDRNNDAYMDKFMQVLFD